MERVHRIQSHPLFQTLWKNLQKAEETRVFCRHTMEHFLDVAKSKITKITKIFKRTRRQRLTAAAML